MVYQSQIFFFHISPAGIIYKNIEIVYHNDVK